MGVIWWTLLVLLTQIQPGYSKLGDDPWFKSARFYWSLDTIDRYKRLQDLQGNSDSKVLGGAITVPGVSKDALQLDGAPSTGADLGEFSKTCISEPNRCKTGFTISFWVKLEISELTSTVVVLQISTNRFSIGTTLYARRNKIGLSVNTRNVSRKVEAPWRHKDWVHVSLIWNKEAKYVDLLINCRTAPDMVRTETAMLDSLLSAPPQGRLVLGANYGFLKNCRVTIDELAVWLRVLPKEEICYVQNARAVDGGFAEWSDFTSCSVTCAQGSRTRRRLCTSPPPQHGGLNCTGAFSETTPCNLRPCPINGNYTQWSEYTPCSKTCGGGTRHRTRSCTNPAPQYGGVNCTVIGNPVDTIECNTSPCPVDGGYTSWTEFSPCSVTCGRGLSTRSRACSEPAPQYGGRNCSEFLGPNTEEVPCFPKLCPIDGFYGNWSAFTRCSLSCGGGTQSRNRSCDSPSPVGEGLNCTRLGPALEIRVCNTQPCPIHGGFSEWTDFGNCTRECDGGVHYRTRSCTNPVPFAGGEGCSLLGPARESRQCNTNPCPVNGAYGPWAPFSPCSATCGGGRMVRRRYCDNPSPQHGGKNCSSLGRPVESSSCNTNKCPDITFFTNVNFPGEKFKATLYTRGSKDFQKLASKIAWNARRIYGKDTSLEDVVVKFCDFDEEAGGIQCMIEFMYGYDGFSGALKLQDALQRRHMLYQMPANAYFITSNDVPWNPPVGITVYNTSSTSLMVRWTPHAKSRLDSVEGYRVRFLDEEGNFYNKVLQGKNATHTTLHGLDKYHYYCVRIIPFSRRGDGLAAGPVCAYTDTDVPSGAPSNITTWSQSPTDMSISWEALPHKQAHGKLLGYKVQYQIHNRSASLGTSNGSAQGMLDITKGVRNITIANLRKFTRYTITVAAYNEKGLGPWSRQVLAFTSEDVPGRAPVIKTAEPTSSTSLRITWHPLPEKYWNGELLGYRVFYRTAGPADPDLWSEIDVGPGDQSADLEGLEKFVTYAIQVAGFNKAGEGTPLKSVFVTTNEDVPSFPPENITAANTSSTSLLIQWSPVPKDHANGIILGYKILYRVSGSNGSFSEHRTNADTTATEVTNLTHFTVYDVSVVAFTSKGDGPGSEPLIVKTAENRPSRPPKMLRLFNTSSTSLHLHWQHIPIEFVHGVLFGYRVLYRPMNASQDSYRALEYGPSVLEAEVTGLLKYSWYGFRVMGFTKVGYGAVSEEEIVRTGEDVPSWPPEEVIPSNKTSPTALRVSWQPISDEYYVHGILLGYKVYYWAVRNPNEVFLKKKEKIIVNAMTLSVVISGLHAYTVYAIQVLAFTSKGDGPLSQLIYGETCNCHATMYTNWWVNPPYNDVNTTGIFPVILQSVTEQCCGYCQEFGYTFINFTRSGNETYAQKPSEMVVKRSIVNQTALSYPVYGRMDQKEYGGFGFVPMVKSGGVVFMSVTPLPGTTARMLVYSVLDLWPMCVFVFVSAFFSGIFMWILDCWFNSDMFPRSPFRGPMEGMWWAFITMTTLGYGDRFPKGYHSKLFAIVWITCGLVIVALLMSFITTSLTAEIVGSKTMVYGTKIAAITNSSEYRLGIRMNARFEPGTTYQNLMDVYTALKRRSVQGALIDSYTVGSRQDLFGDQMFKISKIISHPSSYGVVLSGEAVKLRVCFASFMKEERAQVFKSITDNVKQLEGMSEGTAEEMTSGLFDEESEMFRQAATWSAGALGILTVICLLYELLARSRRTPDPKRYDYSKTGLLPMAPTAIRRHYEEERELMRSVVEEYYVNCRKLCVSLRAKHLREIKLLRKLKEETENGGERTAHKKNIKEPFSLFRFVNRLW
ncbi:uncharacterized protein LOC5501884 isoform X2 [Nematostella vectensis]|uniref:uncharacterized protein LOC5501884 isoform X2 n=1 Tax=Nematostella vectensis TaxID=45351 RepID=UPI00138FA406|nr:uncharacterized protein LOC5501884 isoform X2 [Nematostella vectensis]